MLSAPAMKKAEDAINEAKLALRELISSRDWENMTEANALHDMLRHMEMISTDFTKLECCIYGYELYKYLSPEAIANERWKELEAERKARVTIERKKSANRHCKAMGLETPYPEVEE